MRLLLLLLPALLPATEIAFTVDVRSLPEDGLVRAEVVVPATGPGMVLAYPRWLPGCHAPAGPVENLGGLAFRDGMGRKLAWERDPRDAWRFILPQAPASGTLTVEVVYIANQPSANSEGIDVLGRAEWLVLNWNCLLLYPVGQPVAEQTCRTRILLPEDWQWACPLPVAKVGAEGVRFAAAPLATVVDSPLLAAPRLLRFRLHAADGRAGAVMLHLAGTGDPPDERWITSLRRLVDEAGELFGGTWFRCYDTMAVAGDETLGLEHAAGSLCGLGDGIDDFAAVDTEHRTLIPHELVHSWVGTARRPAGMLMRDWQETPVHDSLWIYEGLTHYLAEVLSVRAGVITGEEWRQDLGRWMGEHQVQRGRWWRSLRDTCRTVWQLRTPSRNHDDMRRDEDFYTEGALFWLMADLRIRQLSGGARSLDDLCRGFFGPGGVREPGFTEAQLLEALERIAPDGAWPALVRRWIDSPGALPLDWLVGTGWRLAEGGLQRAEDEDDRWQAISRPRLAPERVDMMVP